MKVGNFVLTLDVGDVARFAKGTFDSMTLDYHAEG